MMKKILPVLIGLVVLGVGAFVYFNNSKTEQQSQVSTEGENIATPDRPAEINGVIKTIEGNEVIVLKELKEAISEEERLVRQEERQNLSQEERQALRQEELDTVETESVTLIIPVGVPIVKGSGTTDGTNVAAKLTDLVSGVYVSIWLNNNEPEMVKIKGLN
jgi:uncharacterized membrane protein